MSIIKRKTKKKIAKQLKKIVKKHGAEVATGLVSTLIAGVVGASMPESNGASPAKKTKTEAKGKSKSKKKTESRKAKPKTSEAA